MFGNWTQPLEVCAQNNDEGTDSTCSKVSSYIIYVLADFQKVLLWAVGIWVSVMVGNAKWWSPFELPLNQEKKGILKAHIHIYIYSYGCLSRELCCAYV